MDRLVGDLTVLELYCVIALAVFIVFAAVLALREIIQSNKPVEKAVMSVILFGLIGVPALWGAFLIAP